MDGIELVLKLQLYASVVVVLSCVRPTLSQLVSFQLQLAKKQTIVCHDAVPFGRPACQLCRKIGVQSHQCVVQPSDA